MSLSFWRKKSKKLAVHLVFWPIIAVFVIWGFERYGNPAGGAAAVVNDKSITIGEFKNALQRMIDIYSQMTQGNFDEELQKRYRIRETTLQQLINSELLAQAGEKMGLRVSDLELAETISDMPVLKREGRFSKENYKNILAANHLSTTQFESGLRKEALIEKTRNLFDKNLYPSKLELEKQSTLKSKKINIGFLKINAEQAAEKVAITDAEVASFLKEKDSERKLKEYYDLQKKDFSQSEEVKASHILVKAKKGDATEEKVALAKIKKIQGELKKGNFADIAKKYSDDPGSKSKGGSLGWFARGRMVPEFDKAAFSLKPGEVSQPLQTAFGFHLIKLEDKKASKDVSFESAKSVIAKKLIAKNKVNQTLSEASAKMNSNPESAIKSLEALDKSLKWDETGMFSLSEDVIPKIGEDEDLVKDILNLSAEKPYTGKVYKVAGNDFVIKFKKSEDIKVAANDKSLDPVLQSEVRDVFTSWSSKLSERAKIKINPQLFSTDGAAADTSAPMDN